MTNDDLTKPRQLDTGEEIKVYRCVSGEFEAVAFVHDLPGPLDRHSIGDTPDKAAECLQEYVTMLRREANA